MNQQIVNVNILFPSAQSEGFVFEQDVPQKEIAAYLQIDPIALCRIKKGFVEVVIPLKI